MRLYPIDDPQHSEAADLLPWYANGTLDDKERAQVVLVGQAALILLLAAALLLRPDLHYYHTQAAAQGSAHGGGAGLVVIFDGARSEGELRDLLRSLDARVVDGPTAEGAYTLQVPAG